MEPAGISTTSTTFAMSSNANLRIDLQRDANDITLVITGAGLQKSLSHTKILDIAKLSGEPVAVKLTSINFAVEKGLVLLLWWDDGEKDTLICPVIEGQGKVDLEAFGGLHNPRKADWTGHVELSTKQEEGEDRNFMLALGFAKVRE